MKLSIFAFMVFTLAQVGLFIEILLSYKRIQKYVRESKIDALNKYINKCEKGVALVSIIKVIADGFMLEFMSLYHWMFYIDIILMIMTIAWIPISYYKSRHVFY